MQTTPILEHGERFQIEAEHHQGRTYIVRKSDETGIAAFDEAEMKYAERNRTIYCIGRVSLDGFLAAGQFRTV